jgi:hypothetical protein|tara:strand:+ start:750 stop:1256 length:507 start_codon:yes stop_codon:yes gene_type:complete
MSDTYTISKEVMNTIFNKIVSDNSVLEKKNAKHISSILLNELSEQTIESIIHLMLSNKEYKVLKIGDYVKVKPPSYHLGSEYESDVLDDLGLLPTEHGYVYGKVIDDTSWSSGKVFNPFYVRIKVNLFYHDDDKKLKEYEHEVSPLSCIKVNKGTISYFKPKKQNQDA